MADAVGWTLRSAAPNVVLVDIPVVPGGEHWFLIRGDVHWDNPHCDRELERKHLDLAVARGAGVIDVGDLFCAMQGKYDKRSDKSSVRPEHQCGDYLDALVRTAADYYQPYARNFVVIGRGNHECLDDKSEVLTPDGWIPISSVTTEHVVASSHPHTGELVWSKPIRVVDYEAPERMVTIKHRSFDQCLTPNHRVLIVNGNDERKYRQASELEGGRAWKVPCCAPSGNADYPLSDDEIAIAAWILTDGCLSGLRTGAHIYQSKVEGVGKIKAILDRLGWEYSQQSRYREPDGIKIKTALPQSIFKVKHDVEYLVGTHPKVMPSWVARLSDRQFDVFLESFIDGDGSRRGTALMVYGTKAMLEALQIGCVTHGYRASLVFRNRKVGEGYWCLNVTKRSTISVRSSSMGWTKYEGRVYCLTTATGNFFTRRNGHVCITGNSAIRKRHESDLTERLVASLKDRTGAGLQAGGYTGWVVFRFKYHTRMASVKLWYCHGYGGGGPVTVDNIQAQRQVAYVRDADIMVSGHTHDRWTRDFITIGLNNCFIPEHRKVEYIKTATYKDEYGGGEGGWHIETGKPPKPKGAMWLRLLPCTKKRGLRVAWETTRAS